MSNLDGWGERWRAERGDATRPPTAACFDLLAELEDDDIEDAAALVDETAERMGWWRSIAADPVRDNLARIRPAQIVVYEALRAEGAMTDAQLTEHLKSDIRKVVPRRSELVKAGLVRSVGTQRTASNRPANIWAIVAQDEIEASALAAAKKGPRKKKLTDLKIEQLIALDLELHKIPELNEAQIAAESKKAAARRARREAKAAQQDLDRRRREHNERVREAEREVSPQLNFLKAQRQLWRSVDAIREVDRVLQDDLDSIEFDGKPQIAPDNWPEVRAHVKEIARFADEIDQRLARAMGEVDDDVIDVDVIEEVVWELEAGSGGD